jgi:glycosyltransferase involved in cell wall biosynthesis
MNICLVAQVENWRGGIQQYSQNYAEALFEKENISVLGYHSYFPLWLYPGEKERIPEEHRNWKKNVPIYNVLRYYSLISAWRAFYLITEKINADVVDIQWCTTFHAPILIPLMVLLKRFSSATVVVTVHNVLPHETRFFDKPLCQLVFGMADQLVVHSKKMKEDLKELISKGSENVSIIPHGICLDYPLSITREAAKKQLGIKQKFVILFFGLIRKYKGLDKLLAAFKCIKDEFDLSLLIAGDFVDGKEKYDRLISEYGIDAVTYVHAGFVKDEDVPLYFNAADVLVQPYIHFAGQSGVAPTAYYYGKPVIATRVGGLPEIVLDGVTGCVVAPSDIESLANAIRYLFNHPEKMEEFGKNGKNYLSEELSWEGIVTKMIDIYSNGSGTCSRVGGGRK